MKTRKLILKAGGLELMRLNLLTLIGSARRQELVAQEVAKTNESVMQVWLGGAGLDLPRASPSLLSLLISRSRDIKI
jgi:hypothetical protein